MATNHKQNKGIISELVALTYLSKLPDTIVFQAVCSVGPIDIVTFNTKTKEYINYDVKTVSYRRTLPLRIEKELESIDVLVRNKKT
jgi:hypothetical protein